MICSIFKRKRRVGGELVESRYWFGSLRMEWEHGLPRKWCLNTPDKREAERLLHAERVKAEKRHAGMLPPEETTESRERPLNELLETFLGHLRSIGRTESTLKKYRNTKVLFARCGWRRIAHVTARSFCEWREHTHLAGKSVNDLLKNTCNFFEWMRRSRMVAESPLEFVNPVKVTPTEFRRALTTEQAQQLFKVSSPHRAAIYLMALRTGLRRKELQSLTVADFALDAPRPSVRVSASVTKNHKEAVLYLPDEVVPVIRSILPDNAMPFEKVFPRIPRVRTFKKDLKRAGISFEDEGGRRLDLHALRLTFCMDAGDACGGDLRVLQALMRHSDIRTTMRYYKDSSRLPLSNVIAKLPQLTLISGTQMGTTDGHSNGSPGCPASTVPSVHGGSGKGRE